MLFFPPIILFFFFFNDTATTEIYTLSLHDALPIFYRIATNLAVNYARDTRHERPENLLRLDEPDQETGATPDLDRKSTRLNSSHQIISYAVFCLKKKKNMRITNVHVQTICSERYTL